MNSVIRVFLALLFFPAILSGDIIFHPGGSDTITFRSGGSETITVRYPIPPPPPPACGTGTLVVGTDNIGAEDGTLLDENTINHTAPYTAAATGTPQTMEWYGSHTVANDCQGVIYTGDGNTILCQTNVFSCGTSDQWHVGTLSGCPELTMGVEYKLAIIVEGFFTPRFNDAGDFDLCREAATAGGAPASISVCEEGAGDVGGTGHPMSVRARC